MFIYLNKCTNLSQPLVFENINVDISLKNGLILVSLSCLKLEMLINLKKWTDLSEPLLFENRNVDIS